MNKRLNDSKGMTIVEVLVSVIIISLIMGVLFTLLIQVQKVNSDSSKKSTIMISQNVITKAIERDMLEVGVKAISACSYHDFNISDRLIDTTKDYDCVRIEYNQSYDMADVGYILIYKQAEDSDQAAWVMRYGRGYYNNCVLDGIPNENDWKESYSVVQKLDPDVELVLAPSENQVNYSASYLSGKKYSEQKLNNGNLYIPIMDTSNYKYDIDLSFSFRLNYPERVSASSEKNEFICATKTDRLACLCTSGEYCSNTYATKLNESTGDYIYTCSETKASIGSVVGMNKNFINLNNVTKAGIYPSKVNSITFVNADSDKTVEKSNPGIDVSYSQDGTVMMFYTKTDDLYDLYILQSGGVKVYGSSLSSMFSDFTKLKMVDFEGFVSNGVTNMNSMFYDCKSLTTLKHFSLLDFSLVEDVSLMFYQCKNVTESPFKNISLSSILYANSVFSESGLAGEFNYSVDFNAKNVVGLRNFLRKTAITSFTLDYNGEEMPKLLNISGIVSYCSNMTSATFQKTSLPKLTNMDYALYYDNKLTNLHIIDLNTPNLNTLYSLCYYCSSLETVEFENFDTTNVTTLAYAFYYNRKLKDLDLSKISLVNNTSFNHTLYYSGITNLILGNDDTPDGFLDKVEDTSNMLYGCDSFSKFSGKHVTFKGVKNASYMFQRAGNSNLSLDVSDLEFNNCTDFSYMFNNSNYKAIDFSGIHSKVTDQTINFTYVINSCPYLSYFFVCDAEFKTAVNLYSGFSNNKKLTFTSGISLSRDEDITRYFQGEGEFIYKDGRMPFDRFMVDEGYATSLEYFFSSNIYMRGIPDGFLDGVHTKQSTVFSNTFNNSFSEIIPATVDISEENYKKIYKVVIPFEGIIIGESTFTSSYGNNIAVLEFKNGSPQVINSNFTYGGSFKNFGKYSKTNDITLILHNWDAADGANTTNRVKNYFTSMNLADNGKNLIIYLSDDCDRANSQKTHFSEVSSVQAVKTQYISNGCPSVNETKEPTS